MGGGSGNRDGASRNRRRLRGAGDAGIALLDAVLAGVVLLIVLVPATQLLVSSDKVVGNSRDQAIAQGVAAVQLTQDRAAWTSASQAPSYSSSSSCSSTYSATTTNVTYKQYLTSCETVSGLPLWIFQSGGWCYTNGHTLSSTTSTTPALPLYWVEVMVTWGGSLAPGSSVVVPAAKRVVMSSALQTPAGFNTSSVSGSCPL